jgi:hypothetical protein
MRVDGGPKPEYVAAIFIDGKKGPVGSRISGIDGLTLSRDGSYAIYSANTIDRNGTYCYVDDHKAFADGWAEFHAVAVGPPVRLAYLQDFGKTLYLGGRTEPGPIEHFRFSDNGKTYAYVTRQDGQDVVIVNGKPHKRFGTISQRNFQLSADGEHILYLAGNGVVFDNKYFDVRAMPSFPPTLSPDGAHWACRAGNRVVIDAVLGKEYHSVCGSDRDATPFIAFSRIGKHTAHAAVIEITHENDPSEYFAAMIRDGAEEQRFAWVSSEAVFSPDGRHLAYLSSDTAEGNGDRHLTINGARVGKPYGVVPEFSPDSKSIGFITKRPGEVVPVLDGQEQNSYDAIGPEGTRVGFNKNGAYTFVGTREGNYYWVEIRRK